MTPEGIVKAEIEAYLKQSGLLYFRMNSGILRKGARFIHLHDPGTPDLLIFKELPVWVEIKRAGKDTTSKDRKEKQSAFADRVLSLGHKHAMVQSLDELLALLR